MSSKCKHRYCFLLSVLLGAGAWWFVSWLTTSRPLWVRSFQTDDFVVKGISERVVTSDNGEDKGLLIYRLPDNLEFTINQDCLCIRVNRTVGYEKLFDINTGRSVSPSQLDKPIDDSKELQPFALTHMFGRKGKVFDNHIVEAGISLFVDIFPSSWVKALDSKQLLPAWSKKFHFWLRLRDRQSGQTLYTTKAQGDVDFFLTDRWFITIVKEYMKNDMMYRVQAFEMPFSYWSPWWGPGVGLIVTLAFWFMLKRRQPLQG